jgi:hypothetical protein
MISILISKQEYRHKMPLYDRYNIYVYLPFTDNILKDVGRTEALKAGRGVRSRDKFHPGQTSTVVNDRIRRNTAIYGETNDRLRSQYTEAIYGLRFSPYMIVLLRIRARKYTTVLRNHAIRQNTVVYERIRIP